MAISPHAPLVSCCQGARLIMCSLPQQQRGGAGGRHPRPAGPRHCTNESRWSGWGPWGSRDYCPGARANTSQRDLRRGSQGTAAGLPSTTILMYSCSLLQALITCHNCIFMMAGVETAFFSDIDCGTPGGDPQVCTYACTFRIFNCSYTYGPFTDDLSALECVCIKAFSPLVYLLMN